MSEQHVFLSPTPMRRIAALAAKCKALVAVPFLGANASSIMPLRSGSLLVTRVTKSDVELGLVSPSEILAYMRMGVEVHSCANLHAKVYVFGKRAIIGSANVSQSSMDLVEAAVESSATEVVESARLFVEGLRVEPVTAEFVEALVPFYRADRVGGWSARRAEESGPADRRTRARHSRMWVMSLTDTEWSEEMVKTAAVGRPMAKAHLKNLAKHGLEEICWDDRSWARLAEGDRVVQRFANGRGYLFDAPAKIVHIQPSESGGSAVVFLAQRKRVRQVTSTVVRVELGPLSTHFRKDTDRLHAVTSAAAVSAFERLWPVLASDAKVA